MSDSTDIGRAAAGVLGGGGLVTTILFWFAKKEIGEVKAARSRSEARSEAMLKAIQDLEKSNAAMLERLKAGDEEFRDIKARHAEEIRELKERVAEVERVCRDCPGRRGG